MGGYAGRRLELYQQIDEAAGKGKKGKRRRRKGGDEDLDMMADEEVTRLRRKMMDAVEADCQANEERRPATAKLMLLPLVKATMQKCVSTLLSSPHDASLFSHPLPLA
jgi:transcription factor SPN1